MVSTEIGGAGAVTIDAPSERENSAWGTLGFVRTRDGQIASNWRPAELPAEGDDGRSALACRIGRLYGLDAIGHLQRHALSADRLVDAIAAMVAGGRWTAVEIGFVSALAEYIADRRVHIAEGFEVVDLRRAA
jgi:hypothetical protein